MILYRPVGQKELELIAASSYTGFPPRLPEQPIFYPVLNFEYAQQIARDWNATTPPYAGFVTRFEVEQEYAQQFEVHTVGGTIHQELWVLAEELEQFNRLLLERSKSLHPTMGRSTRGTIQNKNNLIAVRRNRFLSQVTGTTKFLILLFIVLIISGCNSATTSPTHSPTVTMMMPPARSLTPPPSATFVPTKTPTIRPTANGSVEPTWTPRPTNTPLVPTPSTNQIYRLTKWTPEKAAILIQRLKEYPETLSHELTGYLDSGYYGAYKYEGLAEMESSVRFPEADQEEAWWWDGAYNLYRSNTYDISSLYADLVADALNSRKADLSHLKTWLAQTTPFSLDTYEVKPPKGYQNSLVLHFYNGEDARFFGGFTVWLLQKEGGFSSYPLANVWEIAYGEGYSNVGVVDITGDGIAEAIVQNSDWGSFGLHHGDLVIYRLDQAPPQKIQFDTGLHDPGIATWSVTPGSPTPTITFQMSVGTETDLPCTPVTTSWQYRWQAGVLKLIQYIPPFGDAEKEMEQRPLCARALVHILGNTRYLENETVLSAYKQMLDLPYITKDITEFEPPFYVEMRRFHLALFLSNRGDEAGAAEQMKLIQASTDPTLAEWRQDVVDFYAAQRDPQTLLQYCLTSAKCGTFLERKELIELIPLSRFSEVEKLLQQMGINSSMNGSYDFDQDGQPEKWLFFQGSYSCGHRFLIVAKGENGIRTRSPFYGICLQNDGEVVKDIEIRPLGTSGGLPGYQIIFNNVDTEEDEFLYWPMDQEDPTVDYRQVKELIDSIQNSLVLKRISPDEARSQLLAIQNLPLQPGVWSEVLQPQQSYLLGLTYELDGEDAQAAKTYLELWQTYPDSPYAIMASAKLEPAP